MRSPPRKLGLNALRVKRNKGLTHSTLSNWSSKCHGEAQFLIPEVLPVLLRNTLFNIYPSVGADHDMSSEKRIIFIPMITSYRLYDIVRRMAVNCFKIFQCDLLSSASTWPRWFYTTTIGSEFDGCNTLMVVVYCKALFPKKNVKNHFF